MLHMCLILSWNPNWQCVHVPNSILYSPWLYIIPHFVQYSQFPTHAPCHTCPLLPRTHTPPPCMSPTTHTPLCHAHPPSATHTPLPRTPPPPWTYPSQTSYSGGNKPILNEPAIIWFSVDNKIFLYVRRWHFKVNLLVYRWKVLEAACNTFCLAGRHLFFCLLRTCSKFIDQFFTVNQTL